MNEPLPPEISGMTFMGVPKRFQDHPLLRTRVYFTLPSPLLRRVVAEVGQKRFDAELLEMEQALSEVCQDHDSSIGFCRGQPISFLLLRPNNDLTDDFYVTNMAKILGKSKDEARQSLALGSQRLDWSVEVRRGYCGWLMTNRVFLDEHRQIFDDWTDEVAKHGIPTMGPVVGDAQAIPGSQLAEGNTERFLQAFEEFFIRWRLECMPAPGLPQPRGLDRTSVG